MSADMRHVDGEPPAKEETRHPREIEIDVLVAHELASGSSAAGIIWDSAGVPRPESPTTIEIEFQYPFRRRAADIKVASNGKTVLIEDKRSDGEFQTGQAEDYRDFQREGYCSSTVLIAPKSFLQAHKEQVDWFTGSVSIEALASALERGAPKGDVAGKELAASYSYRANRLKECANSQEGSPVDENVVAFSEAYREYVRKRNIPGVQVSPHSMEHTSTRTIEFVRWNDADPGFQAYHYLNWAYGDANKDHGCLHFRVPGYRIEELRCLFNAVPANKRPKRWEPCRTKQKNGHPALRFLLPKINVPKAEDLNFEAHKQVVEQAVDALAELRQWWDDCGEGLLQCSSTAAIHWLVLHAASRAHLRGGDWDRVTDQLKAVAQSLPE